MKIFFENNLIKIELPIALYNTDVLHKCFYWYASDFRVAIENSDKEFAVVELAHNNDLTLAEKEEIINRIHRDLIDFKTRDIVTKETANIRDLLIAKAFSPLNEFEQGPNGDLDEVLGGHSPSRQ